MAKRVLTSKGRNIPYETIKEIDSELRERYEESGGYHRKSPASMDGSNGCFCCEITSKNISELELACLLIRKKHPEITLIRR